MFTFLIGRVEQRSFPSATNVFPSGLAAFAELLRQDGFTVIIDRNERPSLLPSDVAVSPLIEQTTREDSEPPFSDKTIKRLQSHIDAGGVVLELRHPADFVQASSEAATNAVSWHQDSDTAPLQVTTGPEVGSFLTLDTDSSVMHIATSESKNVVLASTEGKGLLVTVTDALCATNRYLGSVDNAQLMLSLVRRLCKPGGRVVFTEATINNFDSQGLIGSFGSWAIAAQWQVIILAVLMAFTLGKRFGPLTEDRRTQYGARQIIEALAEVFRRSGKEAFSAEILANDALDRMRLQLRLPPHAGTPEVLSKAPPRFAEVYGQIMAGNLTRREMLTAVADLEDAAKTMG